MNFFVKQRVRVHILHGKRKKKKKEGIKIGEKGRKMSETNGRGNNTVED